MRSQAFNMRNIGLEICANCHKEIRQNESAFVFNGNVVCQKCNQALRDAADPPLPGTAIAAIWEIIGFVSICIFVGCLVFLIITAVAQESEFGEGKLGVFAPLMEWTGAVGIISFSVAAIIKAINANTEELRKIRKTNSEKMK